MGLVVPGFVIMPIVMFKACAVMNDVVLFNELTVILFKIEFTLIDG